MIANLIPRRPVQQVEYSIEFTVDGGGFSFKADPLGNVIIENEDQRANYEYALAHPEIFTEEYNEFRRRTYTYVEPAHGTCRCGANVELYDQYQGACECPRCGQWYNLYGQELLSPECWEE